MSFELARVVDIHPESHSVSVVVMHTGKRLTGVQVMAGVAGGDFGFTDMSEPDSTGYDAKNTGTRDVYAVLGRVNGLPVVVGYLYPQVAQNLFAEKGRMIYRHGSDVSVTIDKDGNTQIAHPSGAFVRIGESAAFEDLSGKDYDAKWKIGRNTGKQTFVAIENHVGGALKSSVHLTPDGNVEVHGTANVEVKADANVRVQAGGDVDAQAGGEVDVQAGGDVRVKAGGDAQVSAGGSITLHASGGSITLKSATGTLTV